MKRKTQNAKLKTRFRFLPDIATADLAFEAFGKNYSELFENAALALEEAMVKLDSVTPSKEYTIIKKEDSLENLLFAFLEELVFLKDAEQMVFSKIDCKVSRLETGRRPGEASGPGASWEMETRASGELIDPEKHKLGVDVKAVTKHLFEVKKLPDKTFRCRIVLDV